MYHHTRLFLPKDFVWTLCRHVRAFSERICFGKELSRKAGMHRGRDDRSSSNSRRRRSRSRSPIPAADSKSRERESRGNQDRKRESTIVDKKEEANFKTSGILVREANTFNGVTLKYSEPAEARKWPSSQKSFLRLYVFKEDNHIDTIPIHKQSAYLLGRERYATLAVHNNWR